jgi:isoleucyl-tRNA synthetase
MTKKSHYPAANQNIDFAKMEEEILRFWQAEKIFEKSVEIRNFEGLQEDDVSPILEPCALKDHANCRHQKEEKSEFVFYDGPPFANGLPHYGHLLTGFIKDLVARYQTMKGKKVERRFGWDTHGLPVEMETEKELTAREGYQISGQIAIQEYGIEKFNDACRKSVMKYAETWENYVTRQGRFVDFKNSYKTMDLNYMESVIWAFKQLFDKGLLYEDFRVVPYSWACQTPLSNFETRMDNSYRQKASKAVTVKFELDLNHPPLEGESNNFLKKLFGEGLEKLNPNNSQDSDPAPKRFGVSTLPQGESYRPKVFLVAWTTTPWTLPSNLALAVGEKIDYAALACHPIAGRDLEILILAENLVEKFAKDFGEFKKVTSLKGSELIGLKYKPLFPYLANHEKIQNNQKAFTVLHGDFVTTDEGTGIVHMAPGFGEDDQLLCKANGIPTLCPVDEGGKFTSEMFDLPNPAPKRSGVLTLPQGEGDQFENYKNSQSNYSPLEGESESAAKQCDPVGGLILQGKQVFETNDDIIKYLKATNAWLKTEQYLHNYPHCWRTDTPLIYRAVSSWYVKVTDFKDRMVELNQGVNWIPNHIKDGQFGKWLEGARDWSITRNRFWGCPVPVWKSESGKIKVFGSVVELEKVAGKKVENLHRPFIDNITFQENGETYKRVSDVLDCWFESGSMPYAQVHYPFENKDWFEENFPADFITEYVAQTRGWFYTLFVLSTALFDRAPFKNVICHGTILDEKSQKLSKRLKNYADPLEIFSTFGSDAMRFYMISQPVMRGQELRIDKDGKAIRDTLRLSIKPLINAFNFFCLYANADGIKANRIEGYGSKSFYLEGLSQRDSVTMEVHKNILDRYILAKLKAAVFKIDEAMKNYDTVIACEEFVQFFEVLNNWYIRRNRGRFWQKMGENNAKNQDKQNAYNTLYTSLVSMCEAAAPLLPFTTEFVWKSLKKSDE